MFKDKKVLGIIPARAKSKRLKNKNIVDLAGKPLITYTIKAGLENQYIDELIVTTDSKEIARISKDTGATVPFIRPTELSEEQTSSNEVIKHAINFLSDEYNNHFDFIILLQPTSPLRDGIEIDKSFRMMEVKNYKALISVTQVDHPPQWSNIIPSDLNMKNFFNQDFQNRRSQDYSNYYRLNGAIYIAELEYFKSQNGFWGEDTFAYILNKNKSIDIDDAWDLKLAEFLIRNP